MYAISFYLDGLKPFVAGDGRIHCVWSIITATGRVISVEPVPLPFDTLRFHMILVVFVDSTNGVEHNASLRR